MFIYCLKADMRVTQKSFNFAKKLGLPFYFVSAADGTNVVKVVFQFFFFIVYTHSISLNWFCQYIDFWIKTK